MTKRQIPYGFYVGLLIWIWMSCVPESHHFEKEPTTDEQQSATESSLEPPSTREENLQEPNQKEPTTKELPGAREPTIDEVVDGGQWNELSPPEGPPQTEQPPKPTPRRWAGVSYANLSVKQRLDIFLPASGKGPFPVIVWVHGGGWKGGNKNLSQNSYQMPALTRGFALVSIGYRLSREATFPAQIHDLKTAIRFLRANGQKYNLNTQKIGAWGSSAGGHLVALLGTSGEVAELEGEELGHKGHSSRVQAVADWFGPTDFYKMDQQAKAIGCSISGSQSNPNSPTSLLLGASIDKVPNLVKQANPITYVSQDDPPFFIQHGDRDCSVSYLQSEILRDAIRQSNGNASAEYQLLKGAGHADPAFKTSTNVNKVLDFFVKVLKP